MTLTFTVAYVPSLITFSVGLVGQSIVAIGADSTRFI